MTMRPRLIQRLLGLFLIIFSGMMIPPILVSLLYQDGELIHFWMSLALTLTTGLLLWYPVRHARRELRTREGFIIVAMFWVVLGLLSTLPFLFGPHLQLVDAFFEAISAFTTTGATVLTGLDTMPRSLLFYRQELQWFGGMGIIVLAVAILPMLGIGGMQLYRAETPGPMKDDKLTPRITQSARTFWLIYVGLTIACGLAYWLAGMTGFDAISHALSTISTGGFSTHDASMGYFSDRVGVEMVANVFMILGGINFSIHYLALRQRSLRGYWRDPEVRAYLLLLLALSLVIAAALFYTNTRETPAQSLRYAAFHVISVMTSTGFTTSDFAHWPLFMPVLLMMASFIGGCAGSTAGGIKVIRFLVLFKQGLRDLRQYIHPNAVTTLRIGKRVLPDRTVNAVWAFFALYVVIYVVFMLLLMANGTDQVTAFSAVATTMNNMGPGLGEVAVHFQNVDDFTKWLLAAAMLIGRLEIFTVLVLLTPTFWRH